MERLSAGVAGIPSNTNAERADTPGATMLAVVHDPERLLGERGLGFHGDVVDALTDLILDAMDQGAENDSDE